MIITKRNKVQVPKYHHIRIGVVVRSLLLQNRRFVKVTNRQLLVSQKEDAASGTLATERHQYIGQLANTRKKQGKYKKKNTLLKC